MGMKLDGSLARFYSPTLAAPVARALMLRARNETAEEFAARLRAEAEHIRSHSQAKTSLDGAGLDAEPVVER